MRWKRLAYWGDQVSLGMFAGFLLAGVGGLIVMYVAGFGELAEQSADLWWIIPFSLGLGFACVFLECVPKRPRAQDAGSQGSCVPEEPRDRRSRSLLWGIGVLGVVSALLFVGGVAGQLEPMQRLDYGPPALFGVLGVIGAIGLIVTWWLSRRWFPERSHRKPQKVQWPRVRFRVRPFKLSVALSVMLAASTLGGFGWALWRGFIAESQIEYGQAMHGIYRAEQEYREGNRRLLEAVEVEMAGMDPEPTGETRHGLDVWRWPYKRLPGGFDKLATEAFVESYNQQMLGLMRQEAARSGEGRSTPAERDPAPAGLTPND